MILGALSQSQREPHNSWFKNGGEVEGEKSKHKGCQSMWQANWVDLFSEDEWRD